MVIHTVSYQHWLYAFFLYLTVSENKHLFLWAIYECCLFKCSLVGSTRLVEEVISERGVAWGGGKDWFGEWGVGCEVMGEINQVFASELPLIVIILLI